MVLQSARQLARPSEGRNRTIDTVIFSLSYIVFD
jgi:hypothetical protein